MTQAIRLTEPCERCGQPQDDRWPGEKGGELCQMCWERECDEMWWEAARNPANAVLFHLPEADEARASGDAGVRTG